MYALPHYSLHLIPFQLATLNEQTLDKEAKDIGCLGICSEDFISCVVVSFNSGSVDYHSQSHRRN